MRLVDVRDIGALSDTLLQVLVFAEQFNALCARRVSEAPDARHYMQSLLLELRRFVLRHTTHSQPDGQRGPEPKNVEVSVLLQSIRRCGLTPLMRPDVTDAVAEIILSPAKVDPKTRTSAEWTLIRASTLASLDVANRGRETLRVYKLSGDYDFATAELMGCDLLASKELTGIYCDEAVDPIAVIQDFLIKIVGVRETMVNHHVQAWLRHQFALSYRKEAKYLSQDICNRFNELSYNKPLPAMHDVRMGRSNTIGAALLFEEIHRILARAGGDPEEGHGLVRCEGISRSAIGLYLFLRFCRVVRCRYHWVDRMQIQRKYNNQRRAMRGGDSRNDLQALDQEQEMFVRVASLRQCISAFRPLDSNYLQTRIFGAILGLPGLNYIFRGGLLPYTQRGRAFVLTGAPGSGKSVLALHLMADVAYRGQLAIHFSFEESRDALVDRLVAFGLVDKEKYQIIEADDHLEARLRDALEERPRRGALVLYGASPDRYDVVEGIERVALLLGNRWRWRALAIDSINALEFVAGAREHMEEGPSDRRPELLYRMSVRHLIDAIEKNLFWGVIVNEQDGEAAVTKLPYLADTAACLGTDGNRRNRWIEILKCRGQHYHQGRHPFRISGGRGIVIYPSLGAIRSTLRKRMKSTLSQQLIIPTPGVLRQRLGLSGVREKSSTLIWGAGGLGKSRLALHFAMEPGTVSGRPIGAAGHSRAKRRDFRAPPKSILLVTFRTSEVRFGQTLTAYRKLAAKWNRIPRRRVRWFSPGENLSGAQLVAELLGFIIEGRREGMPIDRVIFDEVEVADDALPALSDDPLFWPTLLELITTEPVTSFFVAGSAGEDTRLIKLLKSSVDYSFHISKGREGTAGSRIEVEKQPSEWALEKAREGRLRFEADGELI